ncbi:MAG TPA: hypothetical protein VFR93_02625 [Candidatus Limnocylindrales bacterium]|nr:hypothetical protein [Candidatus Limnocylindrales bacterium]
MALDLVGSRSSVIAGAASAQTRAELEVAIVEVARLLDAEPDDPELASLLRGLDERFAEVTRDATSFHETGCFYHPERDPS